ncbi:pilus assembly protein PilM [Planctomycetota bacterium]
MTSASDAVWALDLGNSSLKALHLALLDDGVEVTAFDTIRHAKVLSGAGVSAAEREELIALSLRQFVERNDDLQDDVIVSVPSQSSFARFVTLPPVEAKKVPEVVKFEAVQQIPFDISEVQWDWQMMTEMDSPEKRVGLFAIKNEIVNAELEYYSHEDLQVSYVQMAPMALYNYLLHDRPELLKSEQRPVVVINVGAEITDLVVCTKAGVWQRCIMIGGNAFTRAIADAFKINFEKAEKLKRTAAVSKYARQIFQAMRPVFTDLASEIQKSLGFYSSSNPNAKFSRIVAMGGGTQLRGLLKYLQQSLQIPVERPDMFKRVVMGPEVSAAKFHESTSEFGVVYGLALQGIGMARIESNLLPASIARSHAWAVKFRIFVAAACLLLLVSLLALGRSVLDTVSYNSKSDVRREIASVVAKAQSAKGALEEEEGKTDQLETRMAQSFARFQYRDIIPSLHELVLSLLPSTETNPAQAKLYQAYEQGDIEAIMEIPRQQRKQLFVTAMSVTFSEDLATARFGQTFMGAGGAEGMGEDAYMMDMYGGYEDYSMGMENPTATGTEEAAQKGFLVILQGYSPFQDIGLLLDPPGVDNQIDRWGVVTRLLHLDDLADVNSPFALYEKGSTMHFELLKGPVDPEDPQMPLGVGIPETLEGGMMMTGSNETVRLLDPLTEELISREPAMNQFGKPRLDNRGQQLMIDHDSWFTLKFKLIWRDAPETVVDETAMTNPYGY